MKKLIFSILGFALISCGKEQESSVVDNSITPSLVENSGNVLTEHFEEIHNSGVLLFPLELANNKDISSYDKKYNFELWNIAFYNTTTKKQHLLTKDKILISDYIIRYDNEEKNPPQNKFIFYLAHSLDYNQNKHLDKKDPLYLYISDLNGKNFSLVSPPSMNVKNWKYISHSNKIVLSAQEDTDKNKVFDTKDKTLFFEINLNENQKPVELFSSDLQKEMNTLFQQYWKK